MYRRSASLQDYVLVSAHKLAIDIFHKDTGSKWEITNYQAGDSIELTFPIEEVYEGIIFE